MGSSGENPLIIDYGLGNLLSLRRALEHVGVTPIISNSPSDIAKASRLILPGVGAFSKASKSLHEDGFAEQIVDAAFRGIPILGICLGMQLLFDEGHENGLNPGLGLIPGSIHPILGEIETDLPRTHIGWRDLVLHGSSRNDLSEKNTWKEPFYFVHSYAAVPANSPAVRASVQYGERSIPAVVQRDRIVGLQFHPEKSREQGLALLRTLCSPQAEDDIFQTSTDR